MIETIHAITSLLGNSCKAGSEGSSSEEPSRAQKLLKELFTDESASEKSTTQHLCTFPSFSLDHAVHIKRDDSQSKEEVQMQASSLLSEPMSVDVSGNVSALESMPRIMLENLYSSFDRLVDARILAYSKILGSHRLSLAESLGDDADGLAFSSGARVLEYKLKTLLEIGTNIYADSVVTTFTTGDDHLVEEKDGRSQVTTSITMKVEIHDLHMPCNESENIAKLPVSFSAGGTIQGIFSQKNSNKLLSVNVDIDCNALLASMMEEASKAVVMVVDLTNEACKNYNDVAEDANISTPTPGTNYVSPVLTRPLIALPGSKALNFDCHQHHFDLVHDIILSKSINEESSEEADVDRTVSAENVTAIVDYAIGEIDDLVIAPPAYKKQRVV